MKQFKIYSNQQGKIEAIKQGFSYPALIFTPVWAMVKGMWIIGTFLLIFTIARYAFLVLLANPTTQYNLVDQLCSFAFACGTDMHDGFAVESIQ